VVSAAHPGLDKEKRRIQGLFDSIAPRYDFLNHLLSFQLDRWWRRRAVRELGARADGIYLDACCGTGDLALALLGRAPAAPRVVATDFSLGMLRLALRKARAGRAPHLLAGDTLRLPFADRAFDGAAVAFGIRNVEDLDGGLRELARVIRPGGRLVLLEFTPFSVPLVRPVFHFYLERVLPRLGNWISGSDERAYSYLNDSIRRWPAGEVLADRLRAAGLVAVRWRTLFPGNVALHIGTRG
jgi:demethylmenaquinone methyltransferase/2-methoxy-6-polyprenyl-1,4-benzoquinol methylase